MNARKISGHQRRTLGVLTPGQELLTTARRNKNRPRAPNLIVRLPLEGRARDRARCQGADPPGGRDPEPSTTRAAVDGPQARSAPRYR